MTPSFIFRFVSALARVSARRARRGPEVPEWSFLYETLVEGLRTARRHVETLSVPEQRQSWDDGAMPSPLFGRVEITHAEGAPVRSSWCVPKARTEAGPVVLFFHGGAYGFGSMKTHGELCVRVALASGARVFFPNYRLAPEHPFPAALDDALASYRFLLETEDPSQIVVMGDSAGGGLSLALLLRLRSLGSPLPAGAALICPWVDLTDTDRDPNPTDWINSAWGEAFAKLYLRGHDPRDPLASPHFADLAGLPPLFVQAGSREILFRQISLFIGKARATPSLDLEFEVGQGMVHDWHMLAGAYPEAQRSIESLARFVRSRTFTAGAHGARVPGFKGALEKPSGSISRDSAAKADAAY